MSATVNIDVVRRWTSAKSCGTIVAFAALQEDVMAMAAHLAELAEKHKSLEDRIDRAIASPGSDDLEIRRLKREKLKLKDEIERLSKATRH